MASNVTHAYIGSDHCQRYEFVMECIITGLLCTFGLFGNILSFITFGRMKQRNASVVLFRALAIADSLFLLSVLIYYVPSAFVAYMEYSVPLFDYIYMYIIMCFPIVLILQFNTVWIAVLLAINRYIAVCKPLTASRLCTASNARKQISCVLVSSVIVMSPRFFHGYIKNREESYLLTFRSWAKQSWYQTFILAIYMLFVFVIPFCTIVILGILVICTIRFHKDSPITRHGQQNMSYPVTRLVFVILLVFMICETPALFYQIVYRILPRASGICGSFSFYYLRISNVLAILNSVINFPIDVVLNKTFRKTLCVTCSKG